MTGNQDLQKDQAALWNGVGGQHWVAAQAMLDNLFRPIELLLADMAGALSARAVLDIGCGAGGTTLAIARRLGAAGRTVGVDISEPMVAAARERAEREGVAAQFIRADAGKHAFAPGGFDLLVSRFGVMFFDEPVPAFANLRRAARPGAALRAVVWRDPAENPFMTAAEEAAAPLLPKLPKRGAGEPGQFAFADEARVRHILTESGWRDIDIEPLDTPCSLKTAELARYATMLGPVGLVMPTLDESMRKRVTEAVLGGFAPYVSGPDVRFTAALWTVSARAPAA